MNNKEYYDLLEKHDWFYYFSDDQRVYKRGQQNESHLLSLAKNSTELKELFEGYRNFAIRKTTKPGRPE